MRENKLNITTNGETGTELMSESEQRVFYATLLARVLELYRQQRKGAD